MAMRIALGHIDAYDDRIGAFARQLGLSGLQFHSPRDLPGTGGFWGTAELAALRRRCEEAGLRIEGLENVPAAHFFRIQRGLPGRDEQIDGFCRTLRNMAATGYDLLGYNWLPTYVWRTTMDAPGRGGAAVTGFDLDRAAAGNALAGYKLTPDEPITEPITAEQSWAHHQYFLDAVLPVAEAEGVRLALHPDDPPVTEPLGGATRIFTSPAALAEAWRRSGGSPAWGLDLCLGTVSEMAGQAAAEEIIRTLGPAGKIFYVHFRDVKGTVPRFAECFLGEGNLDVPGVVDLLDSVGFDGFVIDDHVPALVGDAGTWSDTSAEAYISRGRSYAIGYLQGVLDARGR